MAESTGPAPGRSTADAAFNEVKREVARRNEEAHKTAQKLRAERTSGVLRSAGNGTETELELGTSWFSREG